MELTDNILWLLKQAFHFSLKTVNDAISGHGVTTAQIGLMRQLANEPGLSGGSTPASVKDMANRERGVGLRGSGVCRREGWKFG
jgi:hypothetical protein